VSAEQVQPAVVSRGFSYASTIPYDMPASLSDLRGPISGTVRVRPHINTSPDPVYDLSSEAMMWHLYSAVVRDGTAREQMSIMDRDSLVRLWSSLNLPTRCRQMWEAKFPELVPTAGRRSA
jgi:hypothetical protein